MRTIDIAREASISVNTVRSYERLGYLPPVPRELNGYRQFSKIHLQHVLLVRCAMQCTWLGGQVRHTVLDALIYAAEGNFTLAEKNISQTVSKLEQYKIQAKTAIQVLQHWIDGEHIPITRSPMQIGEVADYLDISTDILRNWERNGLIEVPRATNGYRIYESKEIKRLIVIRTLRHTRYSTLSILRMFHKLEAGLHTDLSSALDTPPPDEDLIYATDQWLTTLDTIIASATNMQVILDNVQNPT